MRVEITDWLRLNRGIPPQLVISQLGGKEASYNTISWVVWATDMVPAVRWNKVRYGITHKGFETTGITNQPVEDYGAVCPGKNTFSQYAQFSLRVMKELCE